MRIGVSLILLLVLFVSGAWTEGHSVPEAALGLTRADRRLIQSSLAAEGFDPGPADGMFGRRTRAAIGQWRPHVVRSQRATWTLRPPGCCLRDRHRCRK